MPSQTEASFPRPCRSIQVAPNVHVLPVDIRRVPTLGVFEWHRKACHACGGGYYPVIRIEDAWMRVSEVEKLPLGLSAEVITKLIKGGFVEGCKAAPNSTTVNVASLLEHYEATSEDPEFWTREKLERYRNGI
ncbi:MAG: hypothetical protein ACOYMN_08135 [Roseimicrobium sp.]